MSKPRIRFNGYVDDWEQRKLGEITELKSASRVHKGEWTTEGVPFYRSSDVMAAINGTENDKAFISEELYEKLSSVSGKLEEGDILVTGGGSVGNPYIVPNNDPLYTKDADLLWIKNQGKFNPYFVYEFFMAPSFRSYLGSISHVGTIAHYTITQLSETPISLPSVEEQDKLGEYFRCLDHLITLHQRKYEQAKTQKKYMLQKMFPKNGTNVPEIRFDGFTDAWEQRKVEDVMSCITDYVAAGSFADIRENVTYLNENGYAQLVRTVDLKKKFTNDDFVFVDESAFKYLWRVNLNEACIVLPNIGANIGEVYYVEPSELPERNNVLGPNAILLRTNEDKYFVFTLLSSDIFQKQLFENVGSSGQPKFNKTELKSIAVSIPDINEQEKIGEYFQNLDHLITLHQRKVENLKSLKKACLEKMFV